MLTLTKTNDTTALQRQNRRLARLKAQGVNRSNVFVHRECKDALDHLRPHLVDQEKACALLKLAEELGAEEKVTNVAQVRHLSLFRYPGGKTWLVPTIRHWLNSTNSSVDVFVEPFAGRAIAGLTSAAE